MMRLSSILILSFALFLAPAYAQEGPEPSGEIALGEAAPDDGAIEARLAAIFDQIESLEDVEASVSAGVVTLTGQTLSAEAAGRAQALASRVDGVVAVENRIETDVSVERRIGPALALLEEEITDFLRLTPLIGLGLAVFLVIALLGWLVSRWSLLWQRVTPNRFVADLLATSVLALSLVMGVVAALSLVDATAFLGALLGAAGVIGLAVGFAVKDTIENYVASVMLSVRQPFRPNDHVVIDGEEGRVIRLTSRATILMTLQGNHLRIPNAGVFKAVILNYTRNPERRFEFALGLAPDEDPLAAIEAGVARLMELDFTLPDPAPLGVVETLGDSTIELFFAAWIDQDRADFAKSRSAAIASVKAALEEAGFTLPDPGFRVAIEGGAQLPPAREPAVQKRPAPASAPGEGEIDTSPDTAIARRVAEERREGEGPDLLSERAPTE